MSAKQARFLNERQTEFAKVIAKLGDIKSTWQVWSDFVECMAISISNSVDHESKDSLERESRFMRIMGTYREAERRCFADLARILISALERDQEQDFLGEMFMVLELGSHWKGQFFTPYDVCRTMAAVNLENAEGRVRERGWVAVNDPACGAGATLIAARNALSAKGVGYREALFVGQDIDYVTGLMCYIQLSLLGCAGYVVIADTLANPGNGPSVLLPQRMPEQEIWFMPMLWDEVWAGRIRWERARLFCAALEAKPAREVTAEATAPAVVEKTPAQGGSTPHEEPPAEEREESVTDTDGVYQLRLF